VFISTGLSNWDQRQAKPLDFSPPIKFIWITRFLDFFLLL